jgi:hypothetical protein
MMLENRSRAWPWIGRRMVTLGMDLGSHHEAQMVVQCNTTQSPFFLAREYICPFTYFHMTFWNFGIVVGMLFLGNICHSFGEEC